MPNDVIVPEPARVRPCVTVPGSTLRRRLEEEVAELLARGDEADVQLIGPPASGRTTALRHLAAVFAGDERLALRDTDGSAVAGTLVTVRAGDERQGDGPVLELAPWTADDVLDYLLVEPRDAAARALAAWTRGGDHGLGRWPGVCVEVLTELLRRPTDDLLPALCAVVDRTLPARRDQLRAQSLVRCTVGEWDRPTSTTPNQPLLAVPIVRAVLAAEGLLQLFPADDAMPADLYWSAHLRTAVRHLLATDARLAGTVGTCASSISDPRAGFATSLLCAARAGHRPSGYAVRVADHGFYAEADFHDRCLFGSLVCANLAMADLRDADLLDLPAAGARFWGARLDAARLDFVKAAGLDGTGMRAPGASLFSAELPDAGLNEADLSDVDLRDAVLERAWLRNASLRGADLRGATLLRAHLDGADLRGASCDDAVLDRLDLRTANLLGARLRSAKLSGADLAGTELPELMAEGADFRGANLTGARWPDARLHRANFTRALLGAVDWSGADLRECDFENATFHMGSSRSGLLASATPSEGSRTGYYADESSEHGFVAPEAVRVANLCSCDLRGATLLHCDFYRVDLRGARLDPVQLLWLRRCRAILDPEPRAG